MVSSLYNRCNTSAKMAKFRHDFNIPTDITLKLPGVDTLLDFSQTVDKIHIPIIFIVECGLRLPLDPFFCEVLDRLDLNPMQLCPKFVRVITGTLALNKVLRFNLGWWELHRIYSVVQTADGTYYFKARKSSEQLITDLPDSARGKQNDYLVVSRNWKPKNARGELMGIPVFAPFRRIR